VGAAWLNDHLDDDDLIIVDARGKDPYDEGHIPGAIYVAWGEFTDMADKGPGDEGWGVLLEPANLSQKMAEKGFDTDKTIIVYANNPNGWGEDGRIVWMLRMAGLTNSKMLDGGFGFWNASGFQVSKDTTDPTASEFSVDSLDMNWTISTTELNDTLGSKKIVDSRTQGEYDGAQDYGEKRGGHLPGAILMPFTTLILS